MTDKFKNLLDSFIEISKSYGMDITVDFVLDKYSEDHRHWHNVDHLYDMMDGVMSLYLDDKINKREYNVLTTAAVFHDIIYDTKRNDNEERSVKLMLSKYDSTKIYDYILKWRVREDLIRISDIILGTKTHESNDKLSKMFNKLDTWILDAQYEDMKDWEEKIYQEYKWVGIDEYKKRRIEFLSKSMKSHSNNSDNIEKLINYVNNHYK